MKLQHFCLLAAGLLASASAHAVITIDTVFVGHAGNLNDFSTGYGGVSYGFHIGTYEVTNAQYTAFLNATGATDPYSLYNTGMSDSFGGINRSGSSGSYTYSAISGRENNPVNFVSFWDAARFTNWLTSGNTETGVYVLTPTGIENNTITRDAMAWNNGGVAIASENEWYKAAYYAGSPTGADGDGYWLYPTASNTVPAFGPPPGGSNSANFDDPTPSDAGDVDNVTAVGAYTDSASYYGTFDQGGNVWEWNDTIVLSNVRGMRGGAFLSSATGLQSGTHLFDRLPTTETSTIGFRVSSLAPIPEPSNYAAIFGGLGLLIALMRRRGRKSISNCR